MAGRPREFDQQQALDAAMRVFWMHGYESTSLDDLLAQMGISKSSFYQTFGNKSDLFQQCLTHYQNATSGHLQASLARSTSGWEFIRSTLEGVADGTSESMGRAGCLLMNTATEFGQRDAEVASTVSNGLGKIQQLFEVAIERAKEEGKLGESADPKSLALFVATNLGGLKGMARAGAQPEAMRSVVQIVLAALR